MTERSPAPKSVEVVLCDEVAVSDSVRALAGAEELLAAFTDAVKAAVAEHHAAGHSVYGLDERGHMIEVRPADRPDLRAPAR